MPAIGPHGNTILALEELFLRYRLCNKFILFQDDLICVKNLAAYLTRLEIPCGGWINLINHVGNESLSRNAQHGKLFKATQGGIGAVGLMFSREALIALLGSNLKKETLENPQRYPVQIDTLIGKVMRQKGFTEYCHCPSLLSHNGVRSTLRASLWDNKRIAASFPGATFDAMEFSR